MTPEEAVVKFQEFKMLASGDDYTRSAVLDVLRGLATTAKADETRRCVALLTKQYEELIYTRDYNAASYVRRLRNSILTTGGLGAKE